MEIRTINALIVGLRNYRTMMSPSAVVLEEQTIGPRGAQGPPAQAGKYSRSIRMPEHVLARDIIPTAVHVLGKRADDLCFGLRLVARRPFC